MKYTFKLVAILLTASLFTLTACKDDSDRDTIRKILKQKKEQRKKDNDKKYDCPKLKLNFKDKCKTKTGKVGYVDKNCDCVTKTDAPKYDCEKIKKNVGDKCKNSSRKGWRCNERLQV